MQVFFRRAGDCSRESVIFDRLNLAQSCDFRNYAVSTLQVNVPGVTPAPSIRLSDPLHFRCAIVLHLYI